MAPRAKTEQPKTETQENADIHKNMRFYGLVQDTPQEAQKAFNNGRFSGTDINPMWRIKKLTEIFGPAGFGWWTQNEKYVFESCEATGEIAVFCTLELVVVDPETETVSKPITGVGGNKFVVAQKSGKYCNDEAYKMAYTDALSIACKALGFSHDIYFASDRTKYTMSGDSQPQSSNIPAPTEPIQDVMKKVDERVRKLTANMQPEEKKKFAQDVIIKHIGQMNYLRSEDPVKLKALLETLIKMDNAS
jgi:hypothetical protein